MIPNPAPPLPSVLFRSVALVVAAMFAFAGNSVLCRLALASGAIDPASFTLVRIASGAAALWLICAPRGRRREVKGSWSSATALFGYAAAFSFAYVSLTAGTGALLLFGAVQTTMVATGFLRGERLAATQWAGFSLALIGLVALMLPGVSAPSLFGACLMLLAGAAWGAYSLLGRGESDPISATCGNFLRAVPMALVLWAVLGMRDDWTASGIVPAIVSGVVTSALGYTLWYAALPTLSAAKAASVQLCVPVITALAGAVWLGEAPTFRLALSSTAILGGIALIIASREKR